MTRPPARPSSAAPDSPFPGPDADLSEPDAAEAAVLEALRIREALRDNLICGVSLWAMMGGKPREPARRDVFQPLEQHRHLEKDLWTLRDDDLVRLAGDPHPTVRLLVAQHEPTPAGALDLLADDPFEEVRQAVLGHTSLAVDTQRRMATQDRAPWLREEAAEAVPMVHGRCNRCGGKVKRPDRFLTCSIKCSVEQTDARIRKGTYLRDNRLPWPSGWMWEAACRRESGGIRGTGPGWCTVKVSFVRDLSAARVLRAAETMARRRHIALWEALVASLEIAESGLHGKEYLAATRSARP